LELDHEIFIICSQHMKIKSYKFWDPKGHDVFPSK